MAGPEVFTSPADAAGVADAWRDLVAAAPWSSYFTTPDWVLSWWESLGRDHDGRLAVWRDADGAVDAVVGLGCHRARVHRRVPVAVRRWSTLGAGAGAGDHLGWVVAPGRREQVRRWVTSTAGRRPLVLPELDPDSGVDALLPGARPVAVSRCPRVALDRDRPLPGSKRLHKQVRYDERRLADAGVTLAWRPPGQVGPDLLDRLLELHAARAADASWATSFTAERRRFHLALLGRAAPGRGPAALVAERDGQVVGILYGFRWAGGFAYYQTGWDRAFAAQGLGTVLVAAAIRQARDEGCAYFDFLRGAEAYKYRFGAEDRNDTTWLVPRGPGGALLRASYAAAARRQEGRAPAEPARPDEPRGETRAAAVRH